MAKSAEEIQNMLAEELWSHSSEIKSINSELLYYNEILGDTSFLLANLLSTLLKSTDSWSPNKWIDDALLTQVKWGNQKLSIWGVMIWGIENSTDQWTEPFYFEIELTPAWQSFEKYTFLFGDSDKSEISYEDFSLNRNYWGHCKGNWRYTIDRRD